MSDRRIIRGATMLALDGRRVLRKSDILIEDGIIAAIGGVDAAGAMITEVHGIVMPGLVQAHLHLDQSLLDRHFVPDCDPEVYARVQVAGWVSQLDEVGVRLQAESALARGLRTGTVVFADAGRRAGRLCAIEAATKLGARLVACLDGTGDADVGKDLDVLSAHLAESEAAKWVKLAVWGGDVERMPAAKLAASAKAASSKGVPFFVHLGMMPGDTGGIRKLERAHALGKNLVLAHATGRSLVDPGELRAVGEAQASVVVTPAFDLLMGAPSPQIEKLVANRVNLALGSESGATRIGFDLFKELRLLYRWLIGRVPQPASNALEIATRGGSIALGLGAGSIAVGQPADLILIDVEGEPIDDHELVAKRVIVQGEPKIIRMVWINGQIAFADGHVTKADPPSEEEVQCITC